MSNPSVIPISVPDGDDDVDVSAIFAHGSTSHTAQRSVITVEIDVTALEAIFAEIALIRKQLTKMGRLMVTEAAQLAALDAKINALIADVRAALAVIVADPNELGPEGQAALDAIVAKVDAFAAEVGDADGSDIPPPVEPPVV